MPTISKPVTTISALCRVLAHLGQLLVILVKTRWIAMLTESCYKTGSLFSMLQELTKTWRSLHSEVTGKRNSVQHRQVYTITKFIKYIFTGFFLSSLFPGLRNRWKSMIGKPIDKYKSIDSNYIIDNQSMTN